MSRLGFAVWRIDGQHGHPGVAQSAATPAAAPPSLPAPAPLRMLTCGPQGADYSCGVNSLQALTARVGTSQVRCTVKSKDQYGRNVAACSILSPGGAEDMGEWLVSNGYAVAYRSISKEYVPAEEKARAAKLGIWSGSFEM
jgi:endonuclease YncB( thermonuclease family)